MNSQKYALWFTAPVKSYLYKFTAEVNSLHRSGELVSVKCPISDSVLWPALAGDLPVRSTFRRGAPAPVASLPPGRAGTAGRPVSIPETPCGLVPSPDWSSSACSGVCAGQRPVRGFRAPRCHRTCHNFHQEARR